MTHWQPAEGHIHISALLTRSHAKLTALPYLHHPLTPGMKTWEFKLTQGKHLESLYCKTSRGVGLTLLHDANPMQPANIS